MSFLGPNTREIYLSALRPPEGYTLVHAIGTTYSLHLPTLLSVPLAFALFNRSGASSDLLKDPVLLLEALRQYAKCTTLFCQTGHIALSRGENVLFGALESMVVQVPAPNNDGSFHPKVWALRFVSNSGPVLYRVLVLTRNLTPDRSWDTVLALEGPVIERQNAFARNHPLAAFILALPTLAKPVPSKEVRSTVRLMADELQRVDFEVPEPFDDFEFIPLGIDGYRKNSFKKFDHTRALVISPFLSETILKQISRSDDDVLISRPEAMDAIGAKKLAFTNLFTLEDTIESGEMEGADPDLLSIDEDVSGLHAKLYILESGWNATVITGSANATNAALERNVEFCVALYGMRSKVGIDVFIGDDHNPGIASVLRPHTLAEIPIGQSEADREAEERLDSLRKGLLAAGLIARASNGQSADTFDLEVRSDTKRPISIPKTTAVIWPVTLPQTHARPLDDLIKSGSIVFPSVSLVGLSAFFACEAVVKIGDTSKHLRFVLKLELENEPTGREQAIVRAVVSDRDNFKRYLLLLLADTVDDPASIFDLIVKSKKGPGGKQSSPSGDTLPLLEHLVRAYARNPEKLDPIHRLVEDLRGNAASAALLPEGFERVWDPIWAARQRVSAKL